MQTALWGVWLRSGTGEVREAARRGSCLKAGARSSCELQRGAWAGGGAEGGAEGAAGRGRETGRQTGRRGDRQRLCPCCVLGERWGGASGQRPLEASGHRRVTVCTGSERTGAELPGGGVLGPQSGAQGATGVWKAEPDLGGAGSGGGTGGRGAFVGEDEDQANCARGGSGGAVGWGGDQAVEGRLGTEAGQRHHCAPWSWSLVFT